MNARLFTSGPHLFHNFVAEMRGFKDGEEWTRHFIEMWHATVGKRDTVFILGDLALGGRQTTAALAVMAELPGRKEFILGNHDGAHPMHRTSWVQQRRYLDVFNTVQTDGRIRMAGRTVRLSHFPTNADHTDMPRHMEWRPRMIGGGILLHGHTHNQQKQSSLIERIAPTSEGEQYESILEVHVGLDAWDNRLVREAEINEIIHRHEEAPL